ncbi:MAG: polysaccharide pyruvyl transferase family protein [Lachnospiraceae bacterium]|nr:polysaccharide pyruvyl transferase family protein [Lachnospiraceae bacterium]
MKFGRLVYQYTGKTYVDGNAIFNIGDNIQTFAIDHFYEKMGIEKKDIIDINFCEMKQYDGEYVIVPMAGYASHYKRFQQLPTSDKIIPFFISFEMSDEECDDIVPYLKSHEPIGCRDEETMILLRQKGVKAYTSGCLTVTLPKRDKQPEDGKVFLIDIPETLEKYVPNDLKKNCEYIKHEGTIGHAPMTQEDALRIDIEAREKVELYKREAKLVVTSRLHAAAPCVGLGIPVILAINNVDSRFSWLDKLIPLYDMSSFDKIDWSPRPVDIEELKEKIYELFSKKIKKLWEANRDIYEISSFWEKRTKAIYNQMLYRRIQGLKDKFEIKDKFNYIIWGAGVHGKKAFYMMEDMFPNAELVAVVDKYMDGILFGKKIIKQNEVFNLEFDYALITSHPGRFEAVEVMTKMNKKINTDWCYYISKDIPEENNA